MDLDLNTKTYLATPIEAMQALDDMRYEAESGCVDADVWTYLACRYEAQGRTAMAKRCRGRARHYAEVVIAVSAETAVV